MPKLNPIERRLNRFLRNPASVRGAMGVIAVATVAVVVAGGALMRLIDHPEYSTIWVGMWWAIQTVTTVGYGDVTPKNPAGRIVAAFVMLEGVAFLAIITAAITSTFVQRASQIRSPRREGRGDESPPTLRRTRSAPGANRGVPTASPAAVAIGPGRRVLWGCYGQPVSTSDIFIGFGLTVILAVGCQTVASKVRLPAIVLLLPVGFTTGRFHHRH